MEKEEMGGACSTYKRGRRTMYKVDIGKPEEKRPLGRPSPRFKDTLQICMYKFYSQF
jgi:hypothetical protein